MKLNELQFDSVKQQGGQGSACSRTLQSTCTASVEAVHEDDSYIRKRMKSSVRTLQEAALREALFPFELR